MKAIEDGRPVALILLLEFKLIDTSACTLGLSFMSHITIDTQ